MRVEKGATRIVFVFKKIVIKIPNIKEYKLFLNGLLANVQERQFNGAHPDLCPVLRSSRFGLYVVMQRAEMSIPHDNAECLFETLLKKYPEGSDYQVFLLSDCKPSNWGFIGDRIVKVDYGN